nr:MAG TPA: hypothetical protein [Crassvirales sp.]
MYISASAAFIFFNSSASFCVRFVVSRVSIHNLLLSSGAICPTYIYELDISDKPVDNRRYSTPVVLLYIIFVDASL